jgi:hypothetical protein
VPYEPRELAFLLVRRLVIEESDDRHIGKLSTDGPSHPVREVHPIGSILSEHQ